MNKFYARSLHKYQYKEVLRNAKKAKNGMLCIKLWVSEWRKNIFIEKLHSYIIFVNIVLYFKLEDFEKNRKIKENHFTRETGP